MVRTSAAPGYTLESLTRAQCIALLPVSGVGRLALCDDGRPSIFPVGYAVLGHDIVFMTGQGAKLDAALCRARAAFEVDHVDTAYHRGWSIVLAGTLEEIEDTYHLSRAMHLVLQPWAPGDRHHYVRLVTDHVSGRRIVPRRTPS